MATPPLQTYGKCFESVESYSGAESKPEEADAQETRTNTGFSTCGRGDTSPDVSEKERPKPPSWGSGRGKTRIPRPHVSEAEDAENEPITRQNPPLGEAGFQRQRMFRQRRMVEAVGIEPTSGGQSPQTPTSVSCVLSSPQRTPAGRLPQRLVRCCSPLTPTNLGVPGKLAALTPKPSC